MLQVHDLTRSFKSGDDIVTAVSGISFEVPTGKFASIIGRSGSGKSTLLSLLGGLDKPTSGDIVLDDQHLKSMGDHALINYRCKAIGFVFQNYNLIPNLTAAENVMLPMEFGGLTPYQRRKRAAQLLDQVGLDGAKQNRKPGRLSGGEQQRVAIARALANKPKLILADEPTGNLDEQTGKMIFDLLHSLSRSENTTIVAVTHDLSIAGRTDVTFRLADGKLVET
ncbi:MAG TPA: ABC transporter ATP-binding protein [Candidatus Saccharimonadales bacterium]|nr:ABC transporter ATP-binding protein [Candidatus Saccharimonadales bacterium]